MQANTITIGALAYDRFKETPDKTTYVSANNKVGSVDLLLLGRSVATSVDANAKSRASFVRDIVEDTTETTKLKGRVFYNVECSYPQWASAAQLQAITATVDAFLSSTEFGQLVEKQSI